MGWCEGMTERGPVDGSTEREPSGALPVSGLHSLIAESHGLEWRSYVSWEAALEDQNAVVVLSGDYGGTIYLTAPLAIVRCTLDDLRRLAVDLDRIEWDNESGVEVSIESFPIGSRVPGGMGGGQVSATVWIHPDMFTLDVEASARAVVLGEQDALA